jgi:hypothetical protein
MVDPGFAAAKQTRHELAQCGNEPASRYVVRPRVTGVAEVLNDLDAPRIVGCEGGTTATSGRPYLDSAISLRFNWIAEPQPTWNVPAVV